MFVLALSIPRDGAKRGAPRARFTLSAVQEDR